MNAFPVDQPLKEAIAKALAKSRPSTVTAEIASLMNYDELSREEVGKILSRYGIAGIGNIKMEMLDLVLQYINIALDDNYLTSREAENVKNLKRFFKIKEGDFYKYNYAEIEKILDRQFELLYQDNAINNDEALQKVELQALFDLSYDQFLQLIDKAVKAALNRGANLGNLDTFIRHRG